MYYVKYISKEEQKEILLMMIEKGLLTENQTKVLKKRGSI